MSFRPTFPDLKRLVDDHLDRILADRSGAISEARPLIDEISRLIGLGGKRLRPAFAYWGYRAAKRPHGDQIIAAASSLELLHTFALVHDDIMDSASLRRGEKTTRAVYGDNFALLTGDLALVLADATLMGSGFPSHVLEKAFAVYSRMRQEVIAGQYMDLSMETENDVDEERARTLAMLKSGLYSVMEPLSIGATLAEASDEFIERLRDFGRPLGEAFQLKDDLLGTFGDPDVIGKSADSDISEGKRHLLFVKAVELATTEDRRFLTERWGAEDLAPAEIERLRGIIDTSGARAQIQSLVSDLATDARRLLGEIEMEEEARAALDELITGSVVRES